MKRVLQAVGVAVLAILLLLAVKKGWTGQQAGNGSEVDKYTVTYTDAFDTVTQIMGYADSEEEFEQKAQLLHERLLYYHDLFDIYHSYEEVNNLKDINDCAGKGSIQVAPEIFDLLALSKQVYELTGGKTNVVMGSVLEIWHEYRTRGIEDPEEASLPTQEELKEAAQHCDLSKVNLEEDRSRVFLEDEAMSLDVGSIGKGYAVELLGEYAKEIGLENVLISVGGNVLALGQKPDGSRWKLGIQNPDTESEEAYVCYVTVQDESVVTSGDYQRYYTVDGKRYCHIIDPDTLMPAAYVRSVTVITSGSGLADGLSTALFTMPIEEGKKLVESMEDVEAMWVTGEGELEYSSGFSKYLAPAVGE